MADGGTDWPDGKTGLLAHKAAEVNWVTTENALPPESEFGWAVLNAFLILDLIVGELVWLVVGRGSWNLKILKDY